METLVVHPENKDQLKVVKTILKALKIGFESLRENTVYNPDFIEKIARSEADIKAGRLHKINLDENEKPKRLSEKYWGIINAEQGADLDKHVKEMRNEWERDI